MIACLIPARLQSARLPDKPLLDATGRPLIGHVIEAARACPRFDVVAVATDSAAIADAAWEAGADLAIFTAEDHPTGTDRVAEAVRTYPDLDDASIVVNLQCDEPEVSGEALATLVGLIEGGADMATLATSPPRVYQHGYGEGEVVTWIREGQAIDFSRSRRPERNIGDAASYSHIGVYAFTRDALMTFGSLPRSPREISESLEQLRWLDHGRSVAVACVSHAGRGINTLEDYEDFIFRTSAV